MYKLLIRNIKLIILNLLIILSFFVFGESLINYKYLNKILTSFLEKKLESTYDLKFDIQKLKIDIKNLTLSIPEFYIAYQDGQVMFSAQNLVLKLNTYNIYNKNLLLNEVLIQSASVYNRHNVNLFNQIQNYYKGERKNFIQSLVIKTFIIKNFSIQDSKIFDDCAIKIYNISYNTKDQSGNLDFQCAKNNRSAITSLNNFFTFQAVLDSKLLNIYNLNLHLNQFQIYHSNIKTDYQVVNVALNYKQQINDQTYQRLTKYFNINDDLQESKEIHGTIKIETILNEGLDSNIKISLNNLFNESMHLKLDSNYENKPTSQRLTIKKLQSNILHFNEESFLEVDLNNLHAMKFAIKIMDQDLTTLNTKILSGIFNFSVQNEKNVNNISYNLNFKNFQLNFLNNDELKEHFLTELSKLELINQLFDLSNLKQNKFCYADQVSIWIKNTDENLLSHFRIQNIQYLNSQIIKELKIFTNYKNNILDLQISSQNTPLLNASLYSHSDQEIFVIDSLKGNLKNTKFRLDKPLKINTKTRSILTECNLLFDSGEFVLAEQKTNSQEKRSYSLMVKKNDFQLNNKSTTIVLSNMLEINTQSFIFAFLQELTIPNFEQNSSKLKISNYLSNTFIESHVYLKENEKYFTNINLKLPVYINFKDSIFYIQEKQDNFLVELHSTKISLAQLLSLVPGLKKLDGTFKGYLKLDGSIKNKNVSCNFRISDIQYNTSSNNINLYRAEFNAKDFNNQIFLNDVILKSTDGTYFLGKGQLITFPKIGYEINFTTKSFLVLSKTFSGKVYGNLILSGDIKSSKVTGKIYGINNTLNLLDANSANSALEYLNIKNLNIKNEQTSNVQSKNNPYELYLDFITVSNNSLLMKLPKIRTVASGEVKILGKVGKSFFSGTLESDNGYYSTYGKKFDIQSAKMILNKQISRSYIDMFCATKMDYYNVYIHATGKLYFPNLSFTSTPELKEEEIFSLIAFGTTKYTSQLDNILLSANLGSLITNPNLEEKNIIWNMVQKINLSVHMSLVEGFFLPFSLSFPIRNNLFLEYRNFNKSNIQQAQESNLSVRYSYEF